MPPGEYDICANLHIANKRPMTTLSLRKTCYVILHILRKITEHCIQEAVLPQTDRVTRCHTKSHVQLSEQVVPPIHNNHSNGVEGYG